MGWFRCSKSSTKQPSLKSLLCDHNHSNGAKRHGMSISEPNPNSKRKVCITVLMGDAICITAEERSQLWFSTAQLIRKPPATLITGTTDNSWASISQDDSWRRWRQPDWRYSWYTYLISSPHSWHLHTKPFVWLCWKAGLENWVLCFRQPTCRKGESDLHKDWGICIPRER